MKHFEITEWADFVRGLGSAEENEAMREHLESSCEECQATVMALRRVGDVATADAAEAAPDYAVRSVKALFALNRPSKPSLLERLYLRPVFDSALEPVQVGTRSGALDSDRRMVYVAEEFALDLTVERGAEGSEAVIAGQLLEPEGGPLPNIPTFLVSRGTVEATAVTGDRGSFRLEGGLSGPCELLFFPDDDRTLAVAWE